MNHDAMAEILVAVRAHCRECSGGSLKEVERCDRTDCKLHPYRSHNAYAASRRPEMCKHLDGQLSISDFAHLFRGNV